ncbi:formyl transferase [Novacetimonas maltaceti]|uniref:Glucosamine inositolphosphorylceramide transferase 1 N-terminal domain-containing protein n=1 Tax=Novacetimonas maltaceti TaxID=1203393 RepID=A0A2S3W337_9PROT|nr:formyl transferase [Novacetimonas maltaceti]POF63266.1 hypothetical protein KMAL_11740 [Novacetimonas maltaceti]PYD60085.1 formyl transferase [Novacetimonas maltaceti]
MGLGRTDIWRTGLIDAPMAQVLRDGVGAHPVTWIDNPGPFRFIADPFGVWHDGRLHVFAEAYDYRVKIGRIDVFVFDRALNMLEHCPVLVEPWHLSYPVIVRDTDGTLYMMPESGRSGRQNLYRATDFPYRWEPVREFAFPGAAVDASPIFYEGRWWMFYAPWGHSATDRISLLHVAWADRLMGPWHPHPGNPVRRDIRSTRPGGTPIVTGDGLVLPTQDCARTYGGAITPLHVTTLTPQHFEARTGEPLHAPAAFAPFTDGMHTLSAAGDVTLLDAKHTDPSIVGRALVEVDRLVLRRLRRQGTA